MHAPFFFGFVLFSHASLLSNTRRLFISRLQIDRVIDRLQHTGRIGAPIDFVYLFEVM